MSDGFGIVWCASFRNEDEPDRVMRESPTLIERFTVLRHVEKGTSG